MHDISSGPRYNGLHGSNLGSDELVKFDVLFELVAAHATSGPQLYFVIG